MIYLIEQLFLLLLVAFVVGLVVGWRNSESDKRNMSEKSS